MNGKTLYTGTPYFRPFPAPEDVFCSDIQKHSRHLLPLASLDLAEVNKEWSGWIHFVVPRDPEECVAQPETREFHNYLCRDNWIGYRCRNDRLELATDFRYFPRELQPSLLKETGETEAHSADALSSNGKDIETGYNLQKQRYQKHRYLYSPWAKTNWLGRYSKEDRMPMIQELGGMSQEGNWVAFETIPLATDEDIEDENGEKWRVSVPLTEDGRRFRFIGKISIAEYVSPNPDLLNYDGDLLLFYDPDEMVTLTTFDIS